MKEPSKNNGFTAKDIEQYHAGKLSAEEMHALEKAALDDPFLADALEGFTYTSTATTDLEKIKNRLKEKIERKKIIPLYKKYSWLKIAALFLIVAGSGWLVYQIASPANKQNIAFEQSKKTDSLINNPPNKPSGTDEIKTNNLSADSSSLNNEVVQTNKEIKDVHEKRIVKRSNQKPAKNNNRKNFVPNDKESDPVAVTTVSPINKSNEISKRGFTNNSDRSRDVSSNKPVPDLSKNNFVTKQSNKNEFRYNSDSTTNKDAALNKKNEVQNDTIKNFDVVLKPLPQQQQLSEIVIENGTKKRKVFASPQVIVDTLEPAQGYTNFDNYIASNLKTPDELKIKSVSGEVQLLFGVNKNGEPVNITVVKSLCDKCDEEAIRLLKEGPRWKRKKNKKGKITIRF